jgi:hypothetical protein
VTANRSTTGRGVSTLARSDITEIFTVYKPGVPFEAVFAEQSGEAPPEELNAVGRQRD